MIVYRQANTAQGINILTQAQFDAIPTTQRSSDVIYIIAEFVTASTTHVNITAVWVGNTAQNILLDNQGAIVWLGNVDNNVTAPVAITGLAANPAVTTGTPINNLV